MWRKITIPMCRLLLHSLSITWTSLHISETTGWVYSIQSSVDFCTPVVAQYQGNLPDRDCPWAKNLSNMVPVGSRLCISLKPLDGFYLCPWAKSFSSEITFIRSSWLVVVQQHQGHSLISPLWACPWQKHYLYNCWMDSLRKSAKLSRPVVGHRWGWVICPFTPMSRKTLSLQTLGEFSQFEVLWNRSHQQYSKSLVVKPGTVKPALRQWKIKENHKIKSKLVQKVHDENVRHVNITKAIMFQYFIHLTMFVIAILVKFYCLRSPLVSNLEGKSVVPQLTIRDSEHCWWSLPRPVVAQRHCDLPYMSLSLGQIHGPINGMMQNVYLKLLHQFHSNQINLKQLSVYLCNVKILATWAN